MQKQKNFIITFVLALVMLFTWNTAHGDEIEQEATEEELESSCE